MPAGAGVCQQRAHDQRANDGLGTAKAGASAALGTSRRYATRARISEPWPRIPDRRWVLLVPTRFVQLFWISATGPSPPVHVKNLDFQADGHSDTSEGAGLLALQIALRWYSRVWDRVAVAQRVVGGAASSSAHGEEPGPLPGAVRGTPITGTTNRGSCPRLMVLATNSRQYGHALNIAFQ